MFRCLTLLILSMGLFSRCWAFDPFLLCYENEAFPPMMLGEAQPDQLSKKGAVIDLLELASKETLLPIEFIRQPFKRCQNDLKSGRVDGIFGFSYSEQRSKWAKFPMENGKPDQRYTFLGQSVIFVKKGANAVQWDGATLKPKSALIQSPASYIAGDRLEELGFATRRELTPSQGFTLVSLGRIDGYVFDRYIGQQVVDALNLQNLVEALPIALIEHPVYLAFSKQRYAKNAQEIETFWTYLKALYDQHWDTIIASY